MVRNPNYNPVAIKKTTKERMDNLFTKNYTYDQIVRLLLTLPDNGVRGRKNSKREPYLREEWTMLNMKPQTKYLLGELGNKSDTYDSIISRLLDIYEVELLEAYLKYKKGE